MAENIPKSREDALERLRKLTKKSVQEISPASDHAAKEETRDTAPAPSATAQKRAAEREELTDAIARASGEPAVDLPAQAEELARQTGTPLDSNARESIRGIRGKLARIKDIMRRISPEERKAIQAAITHPTEDRSVPDTAATREIKGILASIDEAAKAVQMPERMRRHSPLMALRPAGESAKVILEGGILTLIANGLLSAFGVVVTPYSAAHGLMYVTATFGVGLANMTTISDRILRPAAEGSLQPLVQKPGRPGFSLLRSGSSLTRIALLSVSVVAGVGMAQDTIRKTYTSSRIAGGIAAPLDKFAEKKSKFEQELINFSKVPGKILEIAGKIEAGKQVGTPGLGTASQQAPSGSLATENPQIAAARKKVDDAEASLRSAKSDSQKAARSKAVDTARAALRTLESAGNQERTVRQSPGGSYVAWSPAERAAMIEELRVAFRAAGMDPGLADRMVFADPQRLGFGRDAKIKYAIRTGDTSDLPELSSYPPETVQKMTALVGRRATTAEYVVEIRAKMGLKDRMTIDQRMEQIVRDFFAHPIFTTVNRNWEQAQRFSGMIKRQGDDVLATGERAFLHGAEPIGPETVVPFANAIIAARVEVDAAAKEYLVGRVKEIFDVMQSALSAAGAQVTLVTPEPLFDTSDIQTLKTFLEQLITDKAKAEVTKDGTQNALDAMIDKFIPGGKKWEETKRWLAVWLMQSQGYYVRLAGENVHIYESADPKQAPGEASDLSIINTVSTYYKDWVRYLSGKQAPTDWKVSRPELEKKSNKELGAEVRPQLEELADERKRLVVTEPEVQAAPIDSYTLSDEEIGKIVREQVDTQRALGQKPVIVSPEIWDAMKKGVPPPGTDSVDMSKWRELSPEATKRVLSEYEAAAAWRGIVYLGGGVGTLILGIMLVSLWPVYNLNRKLRAAAPDFEKELDEAERTLAEGLRAINDSFSAIPVLSNLPPMDYTTLHAALRLAAEETYPATISENPSATTQMLHTVRETFSRGPYSYRVEEIMSFTELIEKLRTSPNMRRRLSDIIAPNVTSAERIARKMPTAPSATGDLLTDMQTQMSEMSSATAEIFRNAARGNLGFRIAVINAQIEALKNLATAETNGSKSAAISDEQAKLVKQLAELEPVLTRLNADDLYARMAISHKKPWVFSRRARAASSAENQPTIVIPADQMTNRRYSVPRGILDDVRRKIDAKAASAPTPTT